MASWGAFPREKQALLVLHTGKFVAASVQTTHIVWFPMQSCLTGARRAQVMKKKAKAVKGKPAGRMLTKTEPCASFFNFFSPPAVPENPNEADEDEMEELQQAMEEDYELGCAPRRPENPRECSVGTLQTGNTSTTQYPLEGCSR